jgi:hypothetical protein
MTIRKTFYSEYVKCEFGDSEHMESERFQKEHNELHKRALSITEPDWPGYDFRDKRLEHGRATGPNLRILSFPQCYYCGNKLHFFGQPGNEPFIGYFSFIGECGSCGWWFCESGNVTHADGVFAFLNYYEGVLRKFSVDDYEVPLDLLRSHLSRSFADIRLIHPRKFEELCRDIFREHFHCDVRLTGYSNDGGIDLYVVESNSPFVVQLKRRSNIKNEGVSAIREFLGTLVLNGVTKGLFVTTAPGYTAAAKEAAANPHLKGLGLKLELADYSTLEGMFIPRNADSKPWKQISELKQPSIKFAPYRETSSPRFPW